MKVLVLTAFYDEAKSLVATLEGVSEVTFGKRKCFRGKSNGHDVYVSFSGIGTTSAAATTTALCERLEPDCILMCGSAGGLTAGQKTGDLVIGESVVDIDLHTLPKALMGTPYEPCLTDPHLATPLLLEHKPHELFLSICASSALPDVTTGKIVTSNTFPAPEAAFKTIRELGCNAIEMESTGVCNAAKHYDIPVIVVRAISNSLDDAGKDLGTPPTALTTCSDRIRDFLMDLLTRVHALEPLVLERSAAIIARVAAEHDLVRHPEGGFYRQTYRATDKVLALGSAAARYSGEKRAAGTSIIFLLGRSDYSAWHTVSSDETWNFHDGASLLLRAINPDTNAMTEVVLGNGRGMTPQYTVPAGHIFSAETLGSYTLVGCAVFPGFDFKDFRLTPGHELETRFSGRPELALVMRLVRDTPVASAAAAKEGFVRIISLAPADAAAGAAASGAGGSGAAVHGI